MTIRVAQLAEEGFQRFCFPHLDEAAVVGAHEIVDIGSGAVLGTSRPTLLVGDDFNGAFKRHSGVGVSIALAVIQLIERLLHFMIDSRPLGISDDLPERLGDPLTRQCVRREMQEPVIVDEAGAVHLEEYFWTDPNKVDLRLLWLALAMLALPHFLIVAIGVLQGWGCIRRARQLRQQSAPGTSQGVSGEAR